MHMSFSKWLVILIIIHHSDNSPSTLLNLDILDVKYNYAKAKVECQKRQMDLYFPNRGINETKLVEMMQNRHIGSIFISAERKQLKDWQWVDNSTFCPLPVKRKRQVQFTKDTNDRCAVFDVKSSDLKPCPCFASRTCHICSVKACDYSTPDLYKCIRQDKHFLAVIGHSSRSWFVARHHCQDSGGDLAKIDTKKKQDDIIEYAFGTTQELATKCAGLYIGLRLDHWVYIRGLTGEEVPVPDHTWQTGEPSNEDCAELVLAQDNRVQLRAKDCVKTNPVLCIHHKEKDKTRKAIQKPCKDECKVAANPVIIAILCVVAVLLVVSVVLFYILLKRKKRKQITKENTSQEGKGLINPKEKTNISEEKTNKSETVAEV